LALLERIRSLGTRSELRASVVNNVRRICASRAGAAPACPRFGIPYELHYSIDQSQGLLVIAKALREAFMASEPRLTAVHVEPMRSEVDAYHFQVTGQVSTGTKARGSIAFRTRLDAGSQFTVEE
jgi:type VI secretion system lysozyme-like protein